MVLKYRTSCEIPATEEQPAEYVEMWNYVDGIIGASIYYDSAHRETVSTLEFETRPSITLALHDEAYLLNEGGRTIEKVRA